MASKPAAEETETVKSGHQLYLEKVAEGVKPDSDISGRVTVNPDPRGENGFIGVDPIYQNFGNDQMKPYDSEEGAEKELEDAFKASFDSDGEKADDPGFGGQAPKADTSSVDAPKFVVDGQVRSTADDKKKEEVAPEPPALPDPPASKNGKADTK